MLSVWCRNAIKNTNINNGVNEVAACLVRASPPGVCHGPILYISDTYSFYLQVVGPVQRTNKKGKGAS